jgi:hypothetical protein
MSLGAMRALAERIEKRHEEIGYQGFSTWIDTDA